MLRWTFLLALFGFIIAAAAGLYAQSEFTSPGPLAEHKVFMVEPGLSAAEIGAALEQNGIISNSGVFALMAQITGQRTKLKAGEYDFPQAASMRDVMGLIASGKSIVYKLSVPEGFTSEMAVARVNANEVLAGPPASVPPEGSILPDTYVFHRGMTKQKLVQDMQEAQTKLLDDLWAKRIPVQGIDTPEQAVTLASIVEKETAVPQERPVIASVFINRLKKGMRLQSDPTIIYGIAGGKGRLDRPLTKADIEADTPYNTYRIKGLPPGPIANPGRASLEAVLSPKDTDQLYFVADGTGGHAFAATLEEHNRNVKKWREIAGNAAAAAAADAGETEAPAAAAPAATSAAQAGGNAAAPSGSATPDAATAAPLADVAPETAPATAGNTSPAPQKAAEAQPGSEASAPQTTQPAQPAQPAQAAQAAQPAPATPVAKPAVPPVVKPSAKPTSLKPPVLKPVVLKPGTIIMVDGRQAVIPKLRPAR